MRLGLVHTGLLGDPSTQGRTGERGAATPRLELVRGDVVEVDLAGAKGVEKQKVRPCLVVQNNRGNRASPMTIIVPITDAVGQDKGYAQQVVVAAKDLGPGAKDSVIECGHLRTIDRDERIAEGTSVWCHLSKDVMDRVDKALRASLAV